jgi:hypothetical protein
MSSDLGFVKVISTNKIHQCNMINNQDFSYGSTWCGLKWTNTTAIYSKDKPLTIPKDYCRRCFKVALLDNMPIGIWTSPRLDMSDMTKKKESFTDWLRKQYCVGCEVYYPCEKCWLWDSDKWLHFVLQWQKAQK